MAKKKTPEVPTKPGAYHYTHVMVDGETKPVYLPLDTGKNGVLCVITDAGLNLLIEPQADGTVRIMNRATSPVMMVVRPQVSNVIEIMGVLE